MLREAELVNYKCENCNNPFDRVYLKDVRKQIVFIHCNKCDTYYCLNYTYFMSLDNDGYWNYEPTFKLNKYTKKEVFDIMMNEDNEIECEIIET